VYPDADPEEAVSELWRQVLHVCRLDETDPVAAWRSRIADMDRAAAALTGRRFDALRLRGNGTDATIGLLPGSLWRAASMTRDDGLVYHPNLPTEEVFTTPDPLRTEGVVAASMPLELGGTTVSDFRVRFEGGRVVAVEGGSGTEALHAYARRDEGAARLGEIALVDGGGRIGPLRTVFHDTLLDENAASHMALGQGFEWAVEPGDRERINRSDIHVDFMWGGDGVDVHGVTADGDEQPVLIGGRWQI
jgi:aminopeptidase